MISDDERREVAQKLQEPVDRDALLKLADKLELNSEFMAELANMRMSDCNKSWSKTVSKDFADIATCIREALGE